MTTEQIRLKYPLPVILEEEGIKIDRHGFCKCIYHDEKTPSMKVDEDFFYSFCCGRHGDVISAVMQIRGLSFRDACAYIAGEELDSKTRRDIALSRIKAKHRHHERHKVLQELAQVNERISEYRGELTPPETVQGISDAYADALYKSEYALYKQDELLRELSHGQK